MDMDLTIGRPSCKDLEHRATLIEGPTASGTSLGLRIGRYSDRLEELLPMGLLSVLLELSRTRTVAVVAL